MSRPFASARLAGILIAWIVLVLVGWSLGELSMSAVQATDVDAVRDAAADRSPVLVAFAHALSFAGSGYVIVPLAVVVCVIYLAVLMALVTGKPARVRAAAAIGAAVLIIAIAISRVYLGVHYPTDVVAGMVLGGTWSVITRVLSGVHHRRSGFRTAACTAP